MKSQKSITSNSIFYFLYTVLNVLFPFITGIYVARILLVSDIGEIEAARNLAQYFVILAFLGIPTYGLREIAKNRENKDKLNKLYSELLIINAISTFVFLIAYLILIFSVPLYKNNLQLYLITGIAIALNFINNSFLYEGLEEFKFISIRNLIFKSISFLLLIIFVRKKEDYLIYALLTVIGIASNYVINIISAPKFVHFTLKGLNLKRHLKPIFYLVFVNLAIEIYSLIDVTMLNIFASKESITYYSYASKIYKIFIQVLNTVTIVLVPRITLYYKNLEKDKFNELISKGLKIILILSLPLCVGIFFTSDYLCSLIYGESYLKSAQVLKILAFALPLAPTGYLLGSRILLVTNNENKMIYAVGLGALFNVVGNLILIYYYQEIGASIATLISEFIVMITYIFLAKKNFKLKRIFSSFIKVIFALIIVIIYLSSLTLLKNALLKTVSQILGTLIIYFGLLLVLKEEIVTLQFNKIKERVLKNGKKNSESSRNSK